MSLEEEVLSRIPERLRKHVEVMTTETLGQDMVYHVSDNKRLKVFHPNVSNRQLGSEDRSIPRISTSEYLTGCIAGHDATDYMFQCSDFDGLFKVYGIPFEIAVKPKAALVADGPQTGERWLITYDQKTEEYPAVEVAEFTYIKVSYVRQKSTMEAEFLLKVTHPDGLRLSKKQHLGIGFYRIVGTSPRVYKKRSSTRAPMAIDSVEPLTAAEYRKEKSEKGVVSMETKSPCNWLTW